MPDDPIEFQSAAAAIEEFLGRLSRPMTVMAAVSGGSDSTGLLIALHQVLISENYMNHRLVAATVDHGLRLEAAEEAQGVARLCEELSIPHRILHWQGEKPKSGVSAAARQARYRLLTDAAEAFGADAIATGHTFDDQAETIAMRAARSSSDSNLGLAGMAEAVLLDRRWWLLRPLLQTRREAIRDFLKEQGRGWFDDPSNADRNYERVRVRASLQEAPALSPALIREAGERRAQLAADAADLAHRYLQVRHGVLACLSPDVINEDAAALRHLLGTLAAILGGRPHMPATATMDRVMAVLMAGQPARTTAGRVIFDLRRQGLYLHREARDLPTLHVAAREHALWDGRYRLINQTDGELVAGPTPPDRELALAMFQDVPPAIAMRARGVMPHIEAVPTTGGAADKASVIVVPVLLPFDRFLPQFELTLGGQLGVLFGCDAFPAAPIKVFGRKS